MNEENRPPPPDRWARLAAEGRKKQKRRDGSLILMLILILAIVVISIGSKVVNEGERRKLLTQREILNNVRQLGMGLLEFAIAYDKFPDASTIAEVKQSTGTSLTLKDATSNDLFKQLLAAKCVNSERVFGAFETYSKPDGACDNDSNALMAGECGFAYVLGPSSHKDPSRPLVFGPVIPGTRNFDLKINEGRVVVLGADHGVRTIRVSPQGRINLGAQDSYLHPAGSVWHGKPLEIRWPK